jgi:hypothetical protein
VSCILLDGEWQRILIIFEPVSTSYVENFFFIDGACAPSFLFAKFSGGFLSRRDGRCLIESRDSRIDVKMLIVQIIQRTQIPIVPTPIT